jgi:hypothetical protein
MLKVGKIVAVGGVISCLRMNRVCLLASCSLLLNVDRYILPDILCGCLNIVRNHLRCIGLVFGIGPLYLVAVAAYEFSVGGSYGL